MRSDESADLHEVACLELETHGIIFTHLSAWKYLNNIGQSKKDLARPVSLYSDLIWGARSLAILLLLSSFPAIYPRKRDEYKSGYFHHDLRVHFYSHELAMTGANQ